MSKLLIPVPTPIRFIQFKEEYEKIRPELPIENIIRKPKYHPEEGILYYLFLTYFDYDFKSGKFTSDLNDFLSTVYSTSNQCNKYRVYDLFDIYDYVSLNRKNQPLLRLISIDLTFLFQHQYIQQQNRYKEEATFSINNCDRDFYLGTMLTEYINSRNYQILPVKITVTFKGYKVGYQGEDKLPLSFYTEPLFTCTRRAKKFSAWFQPRRFPSGDDLEIVFNSNNFVWGFINATQEFKYDYHNHLFEIKDLKGIEYLIKLS